MPEGDQVTDQDYSEALSEFARQDFADTHGTLDSDVKESEEVVNEELAKAEVPTPESIEKEEAAKAEAEPAKPSYITEEVLNERLTGFSEALQRAVQSSNDKMAERIAKMLPREDTADPWVDTVTKYCIAEGVDPKDSRIDMGEGAKSYEEAYKRMRASIGRIQREAAAAPTPQAEPKKQEAAPAQNPEPAPSQKREVVVPPVQKGGGKMTMKDLDQQMASGDITWQEYNKKCAELGRKL